LGFYGSHDPANSVKALKEVVVLRIGFNPIRSTSPCYNPTHACNIHHHTTTVLRPFLRDHPDEPVPEENFWTTEADTPTIRLGATPSRLTCAHLHHPPFFTGRMPFLPPNRQCQSSDIQNTKMNLSTVKWAQLDKTQSTELLGLFICVCIANIRYSQIILCQAEHVNTSH